MRRGRGERGGSDAHLDDGRDVGVVHPARADVARDHDHVRALAELLGDARAVCRTRDANAGRSEHEPTISDQSSSPRRLHRPVLGGAAHWAALLERARDPDRRPRDARLKGPRLLKAHHDPVVALHRGQHEGRREERGDVAAPPRAGARHTEIETNPRKPLNSFGPNWCINGVSSVFDSEVIVWFQSSTPR